MWKAFAEQFKECGRNGTLFILTILGFPALILLLTAMADALGDVAMLVACGPWLVLFGYGLISFIRSWKHPARLGKLPPLSQNELSVARSKLTKDRNRR
jgi:hypothetical protein